MDSNDRFRTLSDSLREAGCNCPTLVLDRDRLDHNLTVLAQRALPALRLVVKSLPSLALLDHCMAALGSRRLMSFHRPFLQQLLARYDDVDILMGKPLPTAAVRQVAMECRAERLQQVQWLVDSRQRLRELRDLACEQKLCLRISLEINVGMQRGGLDQVADLAALEQEILSAPKQLCFSGLMGYDAHAAKAPRLLSSVSRAVRDSQQRYRDFLGVLQSDPSGLTLNGAGSPTHIRHGGQSPLNDISLGSVLVKPTDFDLPDLESYRPALWIATPVLKKQKGIAIPYLSALSRMLTTAGPWRRDSLFLYGGRWMALPAWPQGMKVSGLYGRSSNQQMMTVPVDTAVDVDDWAFFRPTQSEAVMLQFGDIRVLGGQRPMERWPTLVND